MKAENDASFDNPPMSRLFVICGKNTTEELIREEFSKYGSIQKVWFVKDKHSGESKGVAYVKFAKTSDAAAAFEEMNGKIIDGEERPIKVFVASSRNSSGVSKKGKDEERYLRLFIMVNKTTTKDEIMEEFEKYGEIDSIIILKNKKTRESKGVAYVKYTKFTGAALAFENSPQKYKAIFAAPRPTDEDGSNKGIPNKRPRMDEDIHIKDNSNIRIGKSDHSEGSINNVSSFFKLKNNNSNPTTLEVISSNNLNQDQLWRLFDIIPGLDYCQIGDNCGPNDQKVVVVYTNLESAQYAKEKLHGLEYPVGQRLIVRLSTTDSKDLRNYENKNSQDWFCNVNLPPAKPTLDSDTYCAARCFIVLSSLVPVPILRNVFCTFGTLIDVYLLYNKNCGYAKYGSVKSAELAIKTLNNAEICGVKIKVMIADAPKDSTNKNTRN